MNGRRQKSRGLIGIGQTVKKMVPTRQEIRLNEVNARIVERKAKAITYQHTVFCQTGLPYRNPGDDVREWEREQGNAALHIDAGKARDPETKEWVDIGLPYGPKARLILMDLNQRALRTQSPEIDVGDSMTAYIAKNLGIDPSGRNIRAMKDQLGRLSTALIRLAVTNGDRGYQLDTKVISAFDLWFPKDEDQKVLWPSVVHLSEDYFQSLMAHAVPLRQEAIAALAHNAMALDIYSWLAQRAHRIPKDKPAFIPWISLKEQFGDGYNRMCDFKRVYRRTFAQVLRVYPDLRGRWQEPKGLVLGHSAPPVLPRKAS